MGSRVRERGLGLLVHFFITLSGGLNLGNIA